MQAKQIQIDDLLKKLDDTNLEVERIKDEKDQEIAILQEGMDSTIQQLHEAQQVRINISCNEHSLKQLVNRLKALLIKQLMRRLTTLFLTRGRN